MILENKVSVVYGAGGGIGGAIPTGFVGLVSERLHRVHGRHSPHLVRDSARASPRCDEHAAWRQDQAIAGPLALDRRTRRGQ